MVMGGNVWVSLATVLHFLHSLPLARHFAEDAAASPHFCFLPKFSILLSLLPQTFSETDLSGLGTGHGSPLV